MTDGIRGLIALGFDGFVLCAGLGVLAPRYRRLPLSLAFGLCDAAAGALGVLLRNFVPATLELEWPKLLVTLGVAGAALVALVASSPPRVRSLARAMFVLPLVASLDNFVLGARAPAGVPCVDALATAVVSTALAYAGLSLGASLGAQRWGARAAGSAS